MGRRATWSGNPFSTQRKIRKPAFEAQLSQNNPLISPWCPMHTGGDNRPARWRERGIHRLPLLKLSLHWTQSGTSVTLVLDVVYVPKKVAIRLARRADRWSNTTSFGTPMFATPSYTIAVRGYRRATIIYALVIIKQAPPPSAWTFSPPPPFACLLVSMFLSFNVSRDAAPFISPRFLWIHPGVPRVRPPPFPFAAHPTCAVDRLHPPPPACLPLVLPRPPSPAVALRSPVPGPDGPGDFYHPPTTPWPRDTHPHLKPHTPKNKPPPQPLPVVLLRPAPSEWLPQRLLT